MKLGVGASGLEAKIDKQSMKKRMQYRSACFDRCLANFWRHFGKQRVANGRPSAPKGVQRVPKGGPKATQRLQNGPHGPAHVLDFCIYGTKGVPEESVAPKRCQKLPKLMQTGAVFASKTSKSGCREGAKNFEKWMQKRWQNEGQNVSESISPYACICTTTALFGSGLSLQVNGSWGG